MTNRQQKFGSASCGSTDMASQHMPVEDSIHREWLEHAERPPTCSVVACGGVLSERYVVTGLGSAWAMARQRPKEYPRKVDAVTRWSGVCPHT